MSRNHRKWLRLRTLTIALVATMAVTGVASAGTKRVSAGPCPTSNSLGNFEVAGNVGASYANSGDTTTYTFDSWTNEHPSGGVPGLVKYCVYPAAGATPTATATGDNGAEWSTATGSDNFAFMRPGGNKTNIGLDGTVGTTIGTATWSTLPESQTILLHINDAAECTRIYGTSLSTCFVKPGPKPGPVCDTNSGTTGVAYNALPADVVDCGPPSFGFEAQSAREFGDEVGLAGGAATLHQLRVVFNSYACSVSGTWYDASNPCVSTPGATFDWPITANIYAVDNSGSTPAPGALLATVTQTFTIPYRKSADATNCPGTSAWFNPVSGECEYSAKTVLDFNFSSTAIPAQVIWTVAYNTSDYGAVPQRPQACNATAVGCPYDSLNVGTKSYPNAPYAGTDVQLDGVFLNSSWTGAYCGDNGVSGINTLRLDTGACWDGYRPLGEIITT